MNFRLGCFVAAAFVIFSCADDPDRSGAQKRDIKKKEQVFNTINTAWKFNSEPINPASQALVSSWAAWRDLLRELSQKPQSSIGAFQKKSKVLSQKIAELPKQIPAQYNKPEVRSRIAVLTTKINSLDLFINLDEIPAQKVSALINDVNLEMNGLQNQFQEIVRKSQIPKEQGEADMIRMLDTSRAVPNRTQQIP